jgi:hypothetical protein
MSRTRAGGGLWARSIASSCRVRQPCAGLVQSAQIGGQYGPGTEQMKFL